MKLITLSSICLILYLFSHEIKAMQGFEKYIVVVGVEKSEHKDEYNALPSPDFGFCWQDCGNYTCNILINYSAPAIAFTFLNFYNVTDYKHNLIWESEFVILATRQYNFVNTFYPLSGMNGTCKGFDDCFNYMKQNIEVNACNSYVIIPTKLPGSITCPPIETDSETEQARKELIGKQNF